MARDLGALIRDRVLGGYEKIGKVVLVGHSMGTRCALQIAAMWPELVGVARELL